MFVNKTSSSNIIDDKKSTKYNNKYWMVVWINNWFIFSNTWCIISLGLPLGPDDESKCLFAYVDITSNFGTSDHAYLSNPYNALLK